MGLAAKELAGAGAANEFSGVDDGTAAREDGFGRSFDLNALKHGIIHSHMVGFRADNLFLVRIKNHEVGVRSYRDGAFARIKTEEFRGRRGH